MKEFAKTVKEKLDQMEHDTQQYRNKDLSLIECPYF